MRVKDEIILDSDDVRVRIMSLEGAQSTPWHYHTEVVDRMLCLEGEIVVEYRDPDETIHLDDAGHCEVAVNRIHRVVNMTDQKARYLLVQGVGRYDFNEVER